MVEPIGLALGVVGVIAPLIDICTKGYAMLTDARSVGEDWGDLQLRRKIEAVRFTDWTREMKFQDNISARLQPNDSGKYLVVVEILAKIVERFREIDEFMSTYELKQSKAESSGSSSTTDFGTPNSRADGKHKRKGSRFNFLSKSNAGTSEAIETGECFHFPFSKMLEFVSQLGGQNDEAEVRSAVEQFKENTRKFQEAISTRDQIRWVLSGKECLTQAVDELEKYNDRLYKITMNAISIQTRGGSWASPNTPLSSFQEFIVRTKLPFHRNPNFCGRNDVLEKLRQSLKPRDVTEPLANTPGTKAANKRRDSKRKIVVLHGLGGTGKSQIALEYAYRFSHCYTSVFWIDANNLSSTTDSACKVVEQLIDHYTSKWRSAPDYREIANILDFPGKINSAGRITRSTPEAVVKAVHSWLSATENRGWLLLVDNNDKANDGELDKLIPTCDWGSVVVTTRLLNLQRYGKCIEVEEIGAEAGVELLLISSGKDLGELDRCELDEAQRIVEALGELPLALDQAGAYVRSQQITFSTYRERMEKDIFEAGFKKMLPGSSLLPAKASVFTTWELSFRELDENARQLLHMCSFLSNEDIPEELFRRGKSAVRWIMEDESNLNDALDSLFTYSLAKRKGSRDSFWIHPLVHAWAREHVDIATRQRNAEDTIAMVASAIVTDKHKRSSDNWIFEQRILSHLKVCQKNISEYFAGSDNMKAAEASFAIASAFSDRGYYKEAGASYQRALTGYELVLGDGHPSTLDVVSNMASMFYYQGLHDKALKWYQRALAGSEKVLGADNTSALDTALKMAVIFRNRGQYSEAIEWYGRTLAEVENTLGIDHPSTITSLDSMANIFFDRGQYEEALEHYRRTLAVCEKALGNDHPSTLTAANNMARVLYKQRRLNMALECYGRTLTGRDKVLGKDHPSTLQTVRAMTTTLNQLGRYHELMELEKLGNLTQMTTLVEKAKIRE
ncbi:hypothetical protein RUND412_000977 [Rhizina undulata]